MNQKTEIGKLRRKFHNDLLDELLVSSKSGVISNADKDSKASREIAGEIFSSIGGNKVADKLSGQKAGKEFEEICGKYVSAALKIVDHLNATAFVTRRTENSISGFAQYHHLSVLDEIAKTTPDIKVNLGTDYVIKPDVVVVRKPLEDTQINAVKNVVGASEAQQTNNRTINNPKEILHASLSCKWTMRSDRAQNARSEALNLLRNRKGRAPHISIIVGEPMPSRIASLALGTGDLDCVYHFALNELVDAVNKVGSDDSQELLKIMIDGNRLKDISDLPFDLLL